MTFTRKHPDEDPPDKLGVYAFHLSNPDALKQIRVNPSRLLYIGMASSSLKDRNHLEHKNSAFSTLRRSLGALLRAEWQLKAIPRGSGKSTKDVTNYRFDDADERLITDWMKSNLEYAFEVVSGNIEERERDLIFAQHPPLNLTNLGGWRNPQKALIDELRKVCREEAKQGVSSLSPKASRSGPHTASKLESHSLIVAGVMSGTSADGVDAAVCRIAPGRGEGDSPRVKLIGHVGMAYPRAVRADVLRVMEGEAVTAEEMSRLNWRLGAIYADCVERAASAFGVRVGLVGLHGQTVHHDASGRTTWQMGEAAVVAERMRCPVVSDFRPADVAAGGQGAPLVPMLDWCMFRSAKVSRVLQNLGGIGNLTALPAGCGIDGVMAFDTGPGNMVIDACMTTLFGKKYDRGGAVGRRGRVMGGVVERLMGEGYFSSLPPKSCGREEFGVGFAERLIAMCRAAGAGDADCVATATALTAASVVDAYRQFVWAHVGTAAPLAKVEFCMAGGGAKNATLMGMLREGFAELGVKVREMEELGIPAQAKEGVAFALLAWLTWNGRAGNVPAATGAGRAVVLGKISWG